LAKEKMRGKSWDEVDVSHFFQCLSCGIMIHSIIVCGFAARQEPLDHVSGTVLHGIIDPIKEIKRGIIDE
jgi:hypothetical protein